MANYRRQKQYISESELDAAKHKNLLLYQAQRFGWPMGFPIWLCNTLLRSIELNGIVWVRWKIGRTSHGLITIIINYILLALISIWDINLLVGVAIETLDYYVYYLEVASMSVINPIYMVEANPILGMFNLLVSGLAISNKALEQALPVNKKPALYSRGESILMSLISHFITSKPHSFYAFPFGVIETIQHYGRATDLLGIYHRILQPIILGGLGYGIYKYSNYSLWGQDWEVIGCLLIASGVMIFTRDLAIFSSDRKSR